VPDDAIFDFRVHRTFFGVAAAISLFVQTAHSDIYLPHDLSSSSVTVPVSSTNESSTLSKELPLQTGKHGTPQFLPFIMPLFNLLLFLLFSLAWLFISSSSGLGSEEVGMGSSGLCQEHVGVQDVLGEADSTLMKRETQKFVKSQAILLFVSGYLDCCGSSNLLALHAPSFATLYSDHVFVLQFSDGCGVLVPTTQSTTGSVHLLFVDDGWAVL
jgi:hypothetical protein